MVRVKLTAGRIENFNCPNDKQQVFLRDSEQVGLGIRATIGSKAYIFQGKLNGHVVRMTIGSTTTWTIDNARKEARRLKAIIDQGRDPREAKAEITAADVAKRAQAKLHKVPASEAWEAYLKAREGKWSARTLLDHQRLNSVGGKPKTKGRKKGEGDYTLAGPLNYLLALPLAKITRDTVTEWLRLEQHRPTVARNAFVRLRAFLNWCMDHTEYKSQVHPDACSTRIMRAELPKSQPKEDCLQREQLKLWFTNVNKISNPIIKAYLQILLLVGCRREELACLCWKDVNFQWRSLSIADKVDGTRVIPLTPYVAKLLMELHELNTTPPKIQSLNAKAVDELPWTPSPWVFSSPTAADGRIKEPRSAHNKALIAAGLPHVTLHGLRRSFGTLCEWIEMPVGISAQIMGHKPSALAEKHYRRRPLDLLRTWHDKIEAWILEQAGISFVPAQNGLQVAIPA
ncbi:tyrosine-type recombinase/integrase [Noviherbaspirillum aerium]|uniref:tyrosine-type recombinase/integrase n=1 Tax=Noviherbaspirillum aerium TaxID=2588497 RepID=UPI00124C785F|nr:integrase family protein [Noviherbaspirillum aerium]